MKAILLAGGKGTRLRPTTLGINKHLMPVYNKPMIYYSLSVLMLCKFKEVILICDPDSKEQYKKIFYDGRHLGMKIHIIVQKNTIQKVLRTQSYIIERPCRCLFILICPTTQLLILRHL